MLIVISTVSPGFALVEDAAKVGTPSAITGKALNVVVNIIATAVKRLSGLFKCFFIDNQGSMFLLTSSLYRLDTSAYPMMCRDLKKLKKLIGKTNLTLRDTEPTRQCWKCCHRWGRHRIPNCCLDNNSRYIPDLDNTSGLRNCQIPIPVLYRCT